MRIGDPKNHTLKLVIEEMGKVSTDIRHLKNEIAEKQQEIDKLQEKYDGLRETEALIQKASNENWKIG